MTTDVDIFAGTIRIITWALKVGTHVEQSIGLQETGLMVHVVTGVVMPE